MEIDCNIPNVWSHKNLMHGLIIQNEVYGKYKKYKNLKLFHATFSG